jgi:hypothetical protein
MERPLVMEAYLRHRDEIARIIDPALYTMEWLDGQIWSGAFRVMGNDTAVIVVELKQYPTGAREVHGVVAVGELSAILSLIEQAEEWGRSMGCIYGSIASREGWARVMAAHGYEVTQVTIRKVL